MGKLALVLAMLLASVAHAQYFPPSGGGGGGGSPTGAAGGDLGGAYPNPSVANINGVALGSTTATSGNLLIAGGSSWISKTLSGDCTLASTGAITCLKTNGASFGSAALVNTGTIGATVPILNVANTWGATQVMAHLTVEGVTSTGATGTGSFVFAASGALTGTPTAPTQTTGDASTDIATDAFVAAAIVAQVQQKDSVQAATTAALIFSPTYSNGTAGVGATLTATTVGVLVIDGYTPALGDRLLIQNQASSFQNGCYTVTTLGVVVTTDYVLTRCADFNQASNIIYRDTFPVAQGTTNANQQFTMNNAAAITVGTTAITFAQTSGGSQLSATLPVVITGNVISAPTAVTSSSPGVGLAHFPGGTQAVTSSAVVSADLNITTSTCSGVNTITALSAGAVGTCAVPTPSSHSISAAYTVVIGDANTFLYHPGADTTARTWTIDSNANVAYPVNTCLTFFNDTSAGVLTIAITSDTLVLAGAGTTGSRTLAASGVATACKMTTTRWMINGQGLT